MQRLLLLFLIIIFLLAGCAVSSDEEDEDTYLPTDDDDDEEDDDMIFDDDDDNDDNDSGDDDDDGIQRCPGRDDMILVPAGEFWFRYEGQRWETEGYEDELIFVDDFCIDEFEYPNIAGVEPTPVSWNEAEALCAAEGKRLCTGPEWQKACAGPDGFEYPWGGEWDDQMCNTHTDEGQPRDLAPSGEWPDCVSIYGVYDLCGNLSEWTSEVWQEGWPDMSLRGGGFNYNTDNTQQQDQNGFWSFSAYSQRCTSMHHHPPDVSPGDDGTRCCADL